MGTSTRSSAARAPTYPATPVPKPRVGPRGAAAAKHASIRSGSSPQTAIDLTETTKTSLPSSISRSQKRKADSEWLISPAPKKPTPATPRRSQPSQSLTGKVEKRMRRFRDKPPQSFHDVFDRAVSQRFFVLGRRRVGTDECPGEIVELTGSTGNIYTVRIGLQPGCDCPHAKKGNQCKHLVFVMRKVLNAPYNLVYQLALISSELRDIFASAPPITSPEDARGDDGENDKRKPIEGDCPICFSELGTERETIVWCRAACGQNMHQECFQTWAQTKGSGGNVTCPMCRSKWEGDTSFSRIEKSRGTASEGYVNVANQLGISQVRDYSSYSSWLGWHRGVRGGGRSRGGRGGGFRRRTFYGRS